MSAAPRKFVRSIFAKEGECGCQKAYPFGLVHCVREPGHVGWCITANGKYYWHTPKKEEA